MNSTLERVYKLFLVAPDPDIESKLNFFYGQKKICISVIDNVTMNGKTYTDALPLNSMVKNQRIENGW